MILKGQHTIQATSLRGILEALDNLPDSVLDSATITEAELDTVEERQLGGWQTATSWVLTLDFEWPVELA